MSEGKNITRRLPNQVLQAERLRHKWTQQEVAHLIGTTVVNVSRWERGVTSPNTYFRQQLCLLFKKDASALGILPVRQMTQSETLPLTEGITPLLPEKEPVHSPYPTAPLAPQSLFLYHRGTLLMALSVIVAVVVTGSSMLIHSFFFSPSQQAPHTTALQADPPDSSGNRAIDGWNNQGHILYMQDSSDVGGHKGAHALQVIFSSRSPGDMPFVYVNPNNNHSRARQTFSTALFVPPGTSTTIKAELFYVQDSDSSWHVGNLFTLAAGKWNMQRFSIPASAGPIAQVGIQFLSQPYNVPVTVYVDAIQWS